MSKYNTSNNVLEGKGKHWNVTQAVNRRRAPSSGANRDMIMGSDESTESLKNYSAECVESTCINVSNGTQRCIIARSNIVKRRKAKRKRRKGGSHMVAYRIGSSRDAGQFMFANASLDEHEPQTRDVKDVEKRKRTRNDWQEDLLWRTRPLQVEENIELPGTEGEENNNSSSHSLCQRNTGISLSKRLCSVGRRL